LGARRPEGRRLIAAVIVFAHELSERAMLIRVPINRGKALTQFGAKFLRQSLHILTRERLFRDLRGVDSHALRLGVKIGIQRDADGLLGGLRLKNRGSHAVRPFRRDTHTLPVLITRV